MAKFLTIIVLRNENGRVTGTLTEFNCQLSGISFGVLYHSLRRLIVAPNKESTSNEKAHDCRPRPRVRSWHDFFRVPQPGRQKDHHREKEEEEEDHRRQNVILRATSPYFLQPRFAGSLWPAYAAVCFCGPT